MLIDNPDELTPEERLQEIAAILARGILRRSARSPEESTSQGLDSRPNPCLTVPRG